MNKRREIPEKRHGNRVMHSFLTGIGLGAATLAIMGAILIGSRFLTERAADDRTVQTGALAVQSVESAQTVGADGTAVKSEGNAGEERDAGKTEGNAGIKDAGAENDDDAEGDGNKTANPAEADDWNLILVNRWNPIPEGYEVTLTDLVNGHAVDSRIYPDLQQMFDDARAQGILPMISSSFRTAEYQQQLLDEKIAEYQAQGYGDDEARNLAEQWVAIPGTSEHQIGLAVDITTADSVQQDASIVWDWLAQNSYKYGFILRYQEQWTEITGVIPEPWHFRYVGYEAASEIYERGITLEEYLGKAEH